MSMKILELYDSVHLWLPLIKWKGSQQLFFENHFLIDFNASFDNGQR